MTNPAALQKRLSISHFSSRFLSEFPTNAMSSANASIAIDTLPVPIWISKPLLFPIHLRHGSMNSENSIGDIGHPCLTPLRIGYDVVVPNGVITAHVFPVLSFLIRLANVSPNPSLSNVLCKYW